MPTVQASGQRSYPVGETTIPSTAGATFAARQVARAACVIAAPLFTDPNTELEFSIDVLLGDGTWVRGMLGFTQSGSPNGWQQDDGSRTTSLDCDGGVDEVVKGARIRVVVRDSVPGSGLAKPVTLGVVTLSWN